MKNHYTAKTLAGAEEYTVDMRNIEYNMCSVVAAFSFALSCCVWVCVCVLCSFSLSVDSACMDDHEYSTIFDFDFASQ